MDFELSNVGRIHPEPPRPVRRGSLFPENLVLMADITLATLRARLGLGQKVQEDFPAGEASHEFPRYTRQEVGLRSALLIRYSNRQRTARLPID
jgi:hypothetical protein